MIVFVVIVAGIVSLVALSSMQIARLQLKRSGSDVDRLTARALAMAGIEYALAEINTNPNWKTSYAFDTEYPRTLGSRTFAWKVADIGNKLRRIDGIGRAGQAACVFSVNVQSSEAALLSCGLLCGGSFTGGADGKNCSANVQGAPLVSNSTLTNMFCAIVANVEAQTIVNSGNITGTKTVGAPLRSLPDSSSVFDYYLANGTTIATSTIDARLLSPFSNPFGAPNPNGIYIINAGGLDFTIKNSRIVGTIVVINAGEVTVDAEVNWEPAYMHYPALIVAGDLRMRMTDVTLSESAQDRNFNPSLTPYKSTSDIDQNDVYPSALAGIIYCTGNLTVDGKNENVTSLVDGLMIAGGNCSVFKTGNLFVTYNTTHALNPPPGFAGTPVNQIVPGSWRQSPSP